LETTMSKRKPKPVRKRRKPKRPPPQSQIAVFAPELSQPVRHPFQWDCADTRLTKMGDFTC